MSVAAAAVFFLLSLITGGFLAGLATMGRESGAGIGAGFLITVAIYYIAFLAAGTAIQQYIYAATFNYSWKNSTLENIKIDPDLSFKTLTYIRVTNILAMTFTLGLMAPWAKVRRARYILSRIDVTLPVDMS
jgi:uncharacterized membrane protein YjgN (DUF898 family)